MQDRYLPAHTLRLICKLCCMPQSRHQIPVALLGPKPTEGGCIVMLERTA